MTLEEFVGKGWQDHGNDASGVWARLPEGASLVASASDLFKLAHLANHVAGDHLGLWDDGVRFLERMTGLPFFDPATAEGRGLRRLQAVLLYCAGRRVEAEARLAEAHPGGSLPSDSTRVRMLAVAAPALVQHASTARAQEVFEEAVRCATYGPAPSDPAARDLAMAGNNIACELEERAERNEAEVTFMLRAAEIGRRYWEIAGTWKEVERAEYRLAMSHLKAGLLPKAETHAGECLRIVEANGSEAGELFFAHEALACVRLARKDVAAARASRDAAAAALPRIEDADFRSYCEGELAKLDARF